MSAWFQSFGSTIRVLCLSAIEVNVLSLYACSLDLLWKDIGKSLYGHCLAVKELLDRTSPISDPKPASQPVKCKYPYSSEKDKHLRMNFSCWVISRVPPHFSSWGEAAVGATLSRKAPHRAGVLEHFPAAPSVCPQEDLLHHIQSLLFLLMHMPFQIDLVTPNQIYLIWSSWCQMSFWFSNRGSIKSLSWTQHLNRDIEGQNHFSDRIVL